MFEEKDAEKIFIKDEYEQIHESDYALVLGCDTEQALARADIAADFYFKGGAKKLVVTGGVERVYKGEKMSEYKIMRKRLIEKGVPESAIIDEKRASDTIENMVGSLMEICKDCHVLKVRKITVITQPDHLTRAVLTARNFLPPYIEIFGYTQNAKEYFASHRECFSREMDLLNWFVSSSGEQASELIEKIILH